LVVFAIVLSFSPVISAHSMQVLAVLQDFLLVFEVGFLQPPFRSPAGGKLGCFFWVIFGFFLFCFFYSFLHYLGFIF
jgi:hypothetical protein